MVGQFTLLTLPQIAAMTTYDIIDLIIKSIILISILRVWLINRENSTPYRGGGADSMREEFNQYGMNKSMMWTVGILKMLAAIILFASAFVYPTIFEPIGAYTIAALMAGAIVMHLKIGDGFKRSMPALVFLILSLATLYF